MISKANNQSKLSGGVLYISYDGLMEPLGQSQVLAYLEKLANNRPIHILSFEKKTDRLNVQQWQSLTARIELSGIHWHPLSYHKSPLLLSTLCDIFFGIGKGFCLILRYRLRILHARSYVAAAIALVLKWTTGRQFLFDMRGLWADERVDGGIWRRGGILYRLAKWFERQFLLNADHVVCLTEAGKRQLLAFPYIREAPVSLSVIPTCVDLEKFVRSPKTKNQFVLGYVGSAGTWYEFDAAVKVFVQFLQKQPDGLIQIVNRGEHDYIHECLARNGIAGGSIEVRSAVYSEMPQLLAKMSAAVFFIKPVFSKQASAPTKLAELLACGVPCLVNSGVGDMAELVQRENVGIVTPDFSQGELYAGLEQLFKLVANSGIEERCVSAAKKYFSLQKGVDCYNAIYTDFDIDGLVRS